MARRVRRKQQRREERERREREEARRKRRKVVAIVASVVVLGAGLAYLFATLIGAPAAGSLAPDFTLVDSNGATFSLSQFRGTPVVLFFMTSSDWCEPCKVQTRDHLVPLKDTFGDRIQIISIERFSTDRSDADLNAYKAFYGSRWIYARDTPTLDVNRAYGITGLSIVVIVDQSGYIRLGSAQDPPYDQMAAGLRSLGL